MFILFNYLLDDSAAALKQLAFTKFDLNSCFKPLFYF